MFNPKDFSTEKLLCGSKILTTNQLCILEILKITHKIPLSQHQTSNNYSTISSQETIDLCQRHISLVAIELYNQLPNHFKN